MQNRKLNRVGHMESYAKLHIRGYNKDVTLSKLHNKNSIHTSQRTKFVSNINTNLWMLLRERVAVSCENHNEEINKHFSHMHCYILLKKVARITNREFETCCKP